jgi:hypothetical protein
MTDLILVYIFSLMYRKFNKSFALISSCLNVKSSNYNNVVVVLMFAFAMKGN